MGYSSFFGWMTVDGEVASSTRNVARTRMAGGIKIAKTASPSTSNTGRRERDRRPSPLPENLTHTAQSDLSASELADDPVAQPSRLPDRGDLGETETEEETFRRINRPPEVDGLENWGIPEEVDPSEASPALTVGLASSLRG